jgi:hypothetical protein
MTEKASELAHRLSGQAEAVCRDYLSRGRRQGRHWIDGDVRNSPGRSMFVRLQRIGGRERGRGQMERRRRRRTCDLLDVIRESCRLADFHDVADEARRFLRLPPTDLEPEHNPTARERRLVQRNLPGDSSLCRNRLRALS